MQFILQRWWRFRCFHSLGVDTSHAFFIVCPLVLYESSGNLCPAIWFFHITFRWWSWEHFKSNFFFPWTQGYRSKSFTSQELTQPLPFSLQWHYSFPYFALSKIWHSEHHYSTKSHFFGESTFSGSFSSLWFWWEYPSFIDEVKVVYS